MMYIPYSGTNIKWEDGGKSFHLSLPWVSLAVEVDPDEKPWIEEAINNLSSNYPHPSAQKFLEHLKPYNVCYTAPRSFNQINLQEIEPLKGEGDLLCLEAPKSLTQSLNPEIYE